LKQNYPHMMLGGGKRRANAPEDEKKRENLNLLSARQEKKGLSPRVGSKKEGGTSLSRRLASPAVREGRKGKKRVRTLGVERKGGEERGEPKIVLHLRRKNHVKGGGGKKKSTYIVHSFFFKLVGRGEPRIKGKGKRGGKKKSERAVRRNILNHYDIIYKKGKGMISSGREPRMCLIFVGFCQKKGEKVVILFPPQLTGRRRRKGGGGWEGVCHILLPLFQTDLGEEKYICDFSERRKRGEKKEPSLLPHFPAPGSDNKERKRKRRRSWEVTKENQKKKKKSHCRSRHHSESQKRGRGNQGPHARWWEEKKEKEEDWRRRRAHHPEAVGKKGKKKKRNLYLEEGEKRSEKERFSG